MAKGMVEIDVLVATALLIAALFVFFYATTLSLDLLHDKVSAFQQLEKIIRETACIELVVDKVVNTCT